jgi:hypothetical protein
MRIVARGTVMPPQRAEVGDFGLARPVDVRRFWRIRQRRGMGNVSGLKKKANCEG